MAYLPPVSTVSGQALNLFLELFAGKREDMTVDASSSRLLPGMPRPYRVCFNLDEWKSVSTRRSSDCRYRSSSNSEFVPEGEPDLRMICGSARGAARQLCPWVQGSILAGMRMVAPSACRAPGSPFGVFVEERHEQPGRQAAATAYGVVRGRPVGLGPRLRTRCITAALAFRNTRVYGGTVPRTPRNVERENPSGRSQNRGTAA